jgi:hypothetical protein
VDDRVFGAKIGKPVPEWDLAHRLPLFGWVGPHYRDGATTFRVNSTYMDITDQSHFIRQWYSGGVLTAVIATALFLYASIHMLIITASRGWSPSGITVTCIPIIAGLGFGTFSYCFGRKEFFTRTRFPIRFNRRTQKLYALVRGRDKSRSDGDRVEEIDWNAKSIFCIHRAFEDGEHYWIRHYKTDADGNVTYAVAIGRDWEGIEGLEELLANWNFWCWFMNNGPGDLPKPGLFLPEEETIHESFLSSVYEMGFRASPAIRIMFLPFFLILAFDRILSLWTCSPPRWPSSVVEQCKIEADDPYDEPKGSTPVGWHATDIAIEQGTYPALQNKTIDDWTGEPDGRKNALLWAKDTVAHRAVAAVAA